jgi:hypothetical protein
MPEMLWNRLACCLTGHDYSVRSDRTRIYLRCDCCGHTSEGWALSNDPRLKRAHAERVRATDRRTPIDARQATAR